MNRNALIRTVLSFTGACLTGAAVGALFNYAVTALSITGFLWFVMLLISMALAFVLGYLAPAAVAYVVTNARLDAVATGYSALKAKCASLINVARAA